MNEVLDPAGPQAAHIGALWWLMLGVCAAVFVVVMIALAWALWRAPRGRPDTPPELAPAPAGERRLAWAVGAGIAASALLLAGLLVASVYTDRALATLPLDGALSVRVIAHQWWWEVVYEDSLPDRRFTTANELVIPIGRPIVVTLEAVDVIHSFWVPRLHGKKDLIPGRPAQIRLRADRGGEFWGRCAEYCGLEHAFMLFNVVALPADRFAAWADARRKPATDPESAEGRRGRELFFSANCALCHAVQGTPADARKAPDLTHVASRAYLAAGRLANTPQALAEWISDPEHFKPGAFMPSHRLADDDLAALVAYLETLR